MKNKQTLLTVSAVVACLVVLAITLPVSAASQPSPAPAGFQSYGLQDPMGGKSVPELVARIISWVLPLVGSLFLAMFIWGGIMYMTASGESDRVKKATTTLKNAVIGLAIVSLAYVLVFNIITRLGSTLSGATPPNNAPTSQAGNPETTGQAVP